MTEPNYDKKFVRRGVRFDAPEHEPKRVRDVAGLRGVWAFYKETGEIDPVINTRSALWLSSYRLCPLYFFVDDPTKYGKELSYGRYPGYRRAEKILEESALPWLKESSRA